MHPSNNGCLGLQNLYAPLLSFGIQSWMENQGPKVFFIIYDLQSCLCLGDIVNFVNQNVDIIVIKSNYTVMVKAKKLCRCSCSIFKTSQKLACDNWNSFYNWAWYTVYLCYLVCALFKIK